MKWVSNRRLRVTGHADNYRLIQSALTIAYEPFCVPCSDCAALPYGRFLERYSVALGYRRHAAASHFGRHRTTTRTSTVRRASCRRPGLSALRLTHWACKDECAMSLSEITESEVLYVA
jgi:hypothetical protein